MPAPSRDRIAGVLMAGGGATRLGGIAKGNLRKGGKRLAEHNLSALRAVSARQIVVSNGRDYDDLGLPVHRDLRPGQGPLAGLEAALAAAESDFVIVVACDMPSLSPAVLALLAGRDEKFDAVVPVVGGRPEPLCARYSRRSLSAVKRALDTGSRRMISFLDELEVDRLPEPLLRSVDPTLATFENANTPEDLARLGVELP
jgi:molybdopterin-guanine dinucleotide biosynthesis protein A